MTDLGTEFGVEVTPDRQSHLHVFQGKVVVRSNSAVTLGVAAQREMVLGEGESARVEPQGAVTLYSDAKAQAAIVSGFVRKIPSRPTRVIKILDLVDIVAGGNGLGKARGRGINPNTGEVVAHPPPIHPDWGYARGDGRYHRVKGLPLIDGVFMPDDRGGPVQLDSAGHTFAGFGTSDNVMYGYIWAGGKIPGGSPTTAWTEKTEEISTELWGIEYGQPDNSPTLGPFAVPQRSALALIANKGITFDLEAIRRANPSCRILGFHAVAGNTEQRGLEPAIVSADIWVFVDGRPRFAARKINRSSVEIRRPCNPRPRPFFDVGRQRCGQRMQQRLRDLRRSASESGSLPKGGIYGRGGCRQIIGGHRLP